MAYRSSINITGIRKSLSGLNKSLQKAKESAGSISSTILQSNRAKRKYISANASAFRKRREAVRRREREDLVEASTITGAIKRSRTAVVNSTRGFLGRILDFLGVLLVGWALTTLPGIIEAAKNLIKRMQKYFALLNQFKEGLQNFLIGFGDMVGEIYTGLNKFDFLAIKRAVDRGMGRMKDAFVQMNNSIDSVVTMLKQDIKKLLGIENIKPTEDESTGDGETGTGTGTGGDTSLPDPKSAEMYRIAAALSTEGSSDQGYADMMQVVANRKAMGFAGGGSYTDILAAGTGGNNVAFAGVWDRPGGPAGFRRIKTLSDASKWSGQSEATLLKIISLMTDPARQASAASFVGGATEFKGSPQNVKGNPNIAADANGFIPGTVWRGTRKDNQFQVDPSRGDIVRPEGAAPLNLPKSRPAKPPTTLKEGQNIEYRPEELEALQKANPDLDIKKLLGSNVKNYSSQFAMALKNAKKGPKTNTFIFNNTQPITEYVPVASGGGSNPLSTIAMVNSSNSRAKESFTKVG